MSTLHSSTLKSKRNTSVLSSLLRGWYRLTAPPEPQENASIQERDVARRGKLTSGVIALMTIATLASLPIAFSTGNHSVLFPLLLGIIFNLVALGFNRAGKIVLGGIILIFFVDFGYIASIVFSPALDLAHLSTFDLLIESVLLTVSLLPARSVFIVAFLNSVFIILDLLFQPHTSDLGQLLSFSLYNVAERPIVLQFIVAIIAFLWVRSANEALARADRAEEIAMLEQREIERQEKEIKLKQELDLGIQLILQTHVQVANGNYQTRAPLGKENVLWQVSYSLNNLIARLASSRQAETSLQQLQVKLQSVYQDADILIDAVRQAKQQGRNPSLGEVPLQNGSVLAPLCQEIFGTPPTRANTFSQRTVPPSRPLRP